MKKALVKGERLRMMLQRVENDAEGGKHQFGGVWGCGEREGIPSIYMTKY